MNTLIPAKRVLEKKTYLKMVLPVIFQSMFFSLNSVVDNFMVGGIPGGPGGIFSVNAWAAIMLAAPVAIASAASVVGAQYAAAGLRSKHEETIRFRMFWGLVVVSIFIVVYFICSDKMIAMFTGSNDYSTEMHMKAKEYGNLRMISVLIAPMLISINTSLNETGKTKAAFLANTFSLLIHIAVTSITIYGLHMGVKGAAVAGIISRITPLAVLIIYAWKIKHTSFFNYLKIPFVSMTVFQNIMKRSPIIIFSTTTYLFVQLRSTVFANSYPPMATDGTYPLMQSHHLMDGATTTLAITSAIYNAFLGTFQATNISCAYYVGGALGQGDVENAKRLSVKLKYYNTTLALCLSTLLLGISFGVPGMTFLTSEQKNPDQVLKTVQHCLWTIALFNPWWIWFTTSYSSVLAGGRTLLATMWDGCLSIAQVGWAAFMTYVLKYNRHASFEMYYFVFFMTDIVKGIGAELIYYKMDWAHNLTTYKAKTKIKPARA